MRKLNAFEKEVVDVILRDDACKMASVFLHANPHLIIKKDDVNKTLYLIVPKGDGNFMAKMGNEFTFSLIKVIVTITILEKEDYILTAHLAHCRTFSGIIGEPGLAGNFSNNPEQFGAYHFPDKAIHELIYSYWDKHIIATEALEQYKKNNYNTAGKVQFNVNRNLGIIGIIISVLLGISGVWIAFKNSTSSDADSIELNNLIRKQTDSIISYQKRQAVLSLGYRQDSIVRKK